MMSNVILLFGACVAALQLVFVEIKELEEPDGRHQHSFLSCILSKDGAAVIWSISFCNPSRKIFEAVESSPFSDRRAVMSLLE